MDMPLWQAFGNPNIPFLVVIVDLSYTISSRRFRWMDKRYPRHVLYPGVTELYDCMSAHESVQEVSSSLHDMSSKPHLSVTSKSASTSSLSNGSGSGTIFMTARPRGFYSMGKNLTLRHLVTIGLPNVQV